MAPFTRIVQEFFDKYKTRIIVIIIIIAFLITGIYAYQRFAIPGYRRAINQDYANVPRNGKTATLMFFSADWCPHCTKVKPAWITITSNLNNTLVNGFKIECLNVDCSNPDNIDGDTISSTSVSTTMAKYNVKHFPTLILAHADGFVLFDAKITVDTVTEFVVQKTAELTI